MPPVSSSGAEMTTTRLHLLLVAAEFSDKQTLQKCSKYFSNLCDGEKAVQVNLPLLLTPVLDEAKQQWERLNFHSKKQPEIYGKFSKSDSSSEGFYRHIVMSR